MAKAVYRCGARFRGSISSGARARKSLATGAIVEKNRSIKKLIELEKLSRPVKFLRIYYTIKIILNMEIEKWHGRVFFRCITYKAMEEKKRIDERGRRRSLSEGRFDLASNASLMRRFYGSRKEEKTKKIYESGVVI